jgi:hypothetical protein
MDFGKLVRAWLLPLATLVAGFVLGVVFREVRELLAIDWGSVF